ncbi:MAG: hypothetical protein KF753_20825 [Caldilineaceae bacterium]|nr:hypothetical protein [Caldilineaceae bacterium]
MTSKIDGFYDFVAIGELADTTRHFLCLNLEGDIRRGSQGVDRVAQLVLQQARDYLSRVREGFVLSVRTDDVHSRAELGYLLERVLFDWEELEVELRLGDSSTSTPAGVSAGREEPAATQRVKDQLLAFGMAVVALGALPRMPQTEITFPRNYRPGASYSDIPVPHSPGELLHRIEELEEMIWQVGVTEPDELVRRHYDPLRRMYGFFESSAWLAKNDSRLFGHPPARHA